MTDVALGEKVPPLLPGVHRVIRALDADAPLVGLLVTRGDGVAVQLDERALAGWIGWRYSGAEHVAGPVDVVRRRDGHDVLLPWCTERAATFVGRRHAVDPLSAGECSTLVASLLRGIAELGSDAVSEPGGWWMTGEGRPVFVLGEGEDACTAATRLVGTLSEGRADKAMSRLLAQIETGLRAASQGPRVPPRQLEEWETALFDLASSRPLRLEASDVSEGRPTPKRHVDAGRPIAHGERALRRTHARRASEEAAMPSWVGSWAQIVSAARRALGAPRAGATDGSVEHRPFGARKHPRSGAPSGPPPRRRLVLAGACAAIVLVGGLLWPASGADEPAEGAASSQPGALDGTSAPLPAPTSSPDVVPIPPGADAAADGGGEAPVERGDAGTGTVVEPVHGVEQLLEAVRLCVAAEDETCDGVVTQEATALLPDLRELAGARSSVELVDDYGDVAVVRLTPEHGAEGPDDGSAGDRIGKRVVVVIRVEERWLVRDIYDVADQPE
jgi:hypothetical protein